MGDHDRYQVLMMRWERESDDRRKRPRCTLCGERLDMAIFVLRAGRRRMTVCRPCVWSLHDATMGAAGRRVITRREAAG